LAKRKDRGSIDYFIQVGRIHKINYDMEKCASGGTIDLGVDTGAQKPGHLYNDLDHAQWEQNFLPIDNYHCCEIRIAMNNGETAT
jgi:hypothetical protein